MDLNILKSYYLESPELAIRSGRNREEGLKILKESSASLVLCATGALRGVGENPGRSSQKIISGNWEPVFQEKHLIAHGAVLKSPCSLVSSVVKFPDCKLHAVPEDRSEDEPLEEELNGLFLHGHNWKKVAWVTRPRSQKGAFRQGHDRVGRATLTSGFQLIKREKDFLFSKLIDPVLNVLNQQIPPFQ